MVAKSALLSYNLSRDLQKMPGKRLLQSLRDSKLLCCSVSDLQPNSRPFLSLCLWRQTPLRCTKHEQNKALCEMLEQPQWGQKGLVGLKCLQYFRAAWDLFPLPPHIEELNLILCLGCWDSNAEMLNQNLAWFKKRKEKKGCTVWKLNCVLPVIFLVVEMLEAKFTTESSDFEAMVRNRFPRWRS